jgi:DNA-binding beta-propeller fold protein YncE
MYVTQRGLLGFRVIDMRSGNTVQVVHFNGFTWNPRFGPNPPSHGLSLAPDRPELWVLDTPNHALHVFDVSAVPRSAPRRVDDVRLESTFTGPGSLTRSADGRFLYVGGAGDVIDTQSQTSIAELAALQKATAVLEVEWIGGRAVFPGYPR